VIEPTGLEIRRSERPTSGVYELWTKHSVYRLDEELRCIAVEGSDDGAPRPNHECQGAMLKGGHARVAGRTKAFPSLPPPGSYAIFADRDETVVTTSRVLRVVKNVPGDD
jgi:hypothetical protein